jgi:hypothetical protein
MINRSLTTLGKVIMALTDKKATHIPYRESKLTRILSESLGGNSKTCLIITCSPHPYNDQETLSTFRFGQRARSIKNNAKVNREYTIPELKKLANELGISSRVHFTSSVPKEDIYNYISAMDILTLPNTEWYCSPVKLFEYGAFGKTILAVNEAGVSDVMSNEEGLLFENNDSAFQDALLTAITEVDELKIKAKTFQQKVFENHTWRANAQKVIQQINSAQ